MTKTLAYRTAMLALLIAFGACGQATPDAPSVPPGARPSSGVNAAGPAPVDEPSDTEATDVAYEPAYPAEVSPEGLSAEDTAQQTAAHTHGDGEPHVHGDGEDHTHGDGEAHTHGDDEAHVHDGEGNHGDHEH